VPKTVPVRQNVKERSKRQKISDPLAYLPFAAGELKSPEVGNAPYLSYRTGPAVQAATAGPSGHLEGFLIRTKRLDALLLY